MGRLSGKTILVTGAASGIGRAALDLFAREGASLVAVDREERLLAEAVAALEAEAIAVVADVSDPKAVEAVFAEALEEFGRLHGVAHFAGVAHSALSWNLPLEAWEKVLRVNLTGSFLVARKAGEVLEEGGSLVLTGSVAGLGAFGLAHYAAGKLGVVGLARTLALEAGVPVMPASPVLPDSLAECLKYADEIGYPVMLKASWGGGGRGMRVIENPSQLEELLPMARREAKAAG